MSTATQRQYRVVTVNIRTGSEPSVDLDPAHVSKDRKDVLCWHCETDPNWEVDFGSDSPFGKSRFNQRDGNSGPPKDAATIGKKYKYTVRAGGGTLDPGAIVDQ